MRVVSWRKFAVAASLVFPSPPVNAQTVAAVGQLPPVTVMPPEAAPPKRIKSSPRRARSVSAVQTTPPAAPALVVNGVHLLENMKLDELAQKQVYEFAFMMQPLKIQGGTGSTVSPIAVR